MYTFFFSPSTNIISPSNWLLAVRNFGTCCFPFNKNDMNEKLLILHQVNGGTKGLNLIETSELRSHNDIELLVKKFKKVDH